ncbi:MAG: SHOCT domain-containing protein [Pseudomonadota bacterium]
MIDKKDKTDDGTVRGVLLAYLVLVLHLVFIALLGILVLFFRGVVNYMLWIFIGGSAVIVIAAWLFYRRMKREGKSLGEMLSSSDFRGRSVEISLLGGFASMKIGDTGAPPLLDTRTVRPTYQLEDGTTQRIRELTELARLFEKELITPEEFESAKQQLLRP